MGKATLLSLGNGRFVHSKPTRKCSFVKVAFHLWFFMLCRFWVSQSIYLRKALLHIIKKAAQGHWNLWSYYLAYCTGKWWHHPKCETATAGRIVLFWRKERCRNISTNVHGCKLAEWWPYGVYSKLSGAPFTASAIFVWDSGKRFPIPKERPNFNAHADYVLTVAER